VTITIFQCESLEDFLSSEARAQMEHEYHYPPSLDGDCKHCGEPLGLDDDPYTQSCGFCGRPIYGGP